MTRAGEECWIEKGCNLPYCPRCWKSKIMRIRDSIGGQLWNWASGWVWMLTRSTRNCDDVWQAEADLKATRERWRKQAERDPLHPWNLVKDWVGVTEIKRGKMADPSTSVPRPRTTTLGWNVHDHLLIHLETNWTDYGDWQRRWKLAAMDPAAHLDLQQVEKSAMGYLTKYLSKGQMWGGLTISQARSIETFLKGRRFLRRKRGSAPKALVEFDARGPWTECCDPLDSRSCELDGLWDHF